MEAKAKAFEVDLQFGKDVDIQEFFIEGDSQVVYRALSEISPPPLPPFLIPSFLLSLVCKLFVISFVGLNSLMYVCKVIDRFTFQQNMLALDTGDFHACIEKNRCFIEQVLIQYVVSISNYE